MGVDPVGIGQQEKYMDEHQVYNEDLHRALEAFVSSARYGFLKRLQIGRLIGADADSLGAVADLTFEALVELGIEQLRTLSTVQKRVLVSTLFALSEGEASTHDGEGEGKGEGPGATGPVISSVQAENELREKIRALELHPEFERNKRQKLGVFWDPQWERAPFEEAFSLSQLVGIDLSTLQKKRPVSTARVVLLTKAVERVLLTLSGESAPTQAQYSQSRPEAPSSRVHSDGKTVRPTVALPVEEPRLHPWMAEAGSFAIAEVALLEYVLEQPAREQVARSSKAKLISSLATVFSASDIVLLAQLQEPAKPLLKKLKNWFSSYADNAEIAMLKEALQGPGVHLDKVLTLLSLTDWPPSFARLFAVLVLRAIGAQPIRYQGRECSVVYSLNPGLAQLIVSGLKGSGRSAAALSNLLKVACPAMDPFLHEWLCQAVKSLKRR